MVHSPDEGALLEDRHLDAPGVDRHGRIAFFGAWGVLSLLAWVPALRQI